MYAYLCVHIYIVTTRRIKYPKTNNKKQNTKQSENNDITITLCVE